MSFNYDFFSFSMKVKEKIVESALYNNNNNINNETVYISKRKLHAH